MTLIVSVSQFRQHISYYISKAKEGHTVILKDEKRGDEIVKLVTRKKFNPEIFAEALREASGVFTNQQHPEWQTKKDIIRWVEKTRLTADRSF